MNPKAMKPFGKALPAYLEGDSEAEVALRRDDGKATAIPVAQFVGDEPNSTEIETTVTKLCEGRVLDVGAGAGSLRTGLRRKGHLVNALDIGPEAVEVARRRSVNEVGCADTLMRTGERDCASRVASSGGRAS
jgi:SAM-dependent methyltransferase